MNNLVADDETRLKNIIKKSLICGTLKQNALRSSRTSTKETSLKIEIIIKR